MSSRPREIGTLIVVILKARNLPNKRHIGKQDPFCTVVLNGEKKRTKAIRRGGQHPEWDEEVRFAVYEDPEDEANRALSEGVDPPPPPPKSAGKGTPKIQGGNSMAIACYAEDPRASDLIGEGIVDLTEVLTKGETDEWFTLMHKDKYCGEVYLELTFWSNEPPPSKKSAAKPKTYKQYGGPGSFVPAVDNGIDGHPLLFRESSAATHQQEIRRESLPPSLRTSQSTARLDLYVPPYESVRSHISADNVATEFAELSVGSSRSRRQSFPNGYAQRSSSVDFYEQPRANSQSSQNFHQSPYSESVYSPDAASDSEPYFQSPYSAGDEQQQYAPSPPSSNFQAPVRHSRYSIPTSSSGFMPLPTPAPSGFMPLPPRPSVPSGFAPSNALTPAPARYGSHSPTPSPSNPPQVQSQMTGFSTASLSYPSSGPYTQSLSPQQTSGYNYAPHAPPRPPSTIPPQSLTGPTAAQMAQMAPQPYVPPALPQTSTPQQQYPSQQQYTPPSQQQYLPPPPQHYAPPPVPPQHTPVQAAQQYYTPTPPSRHPSVSSLSHSAVSEQYSGNSAPSPPHLSIPPPPPQESASPIQTTPTSRPLPQPQAYGQQGRRQTSLPIPPGPPGSFNPPAGQGIAFPVAMAYNSAPPPPLQQPHAQQPSYMPSQISNPGPPPPLHPSSSLHHKPPTRRPSLPTPPVNYGGQNQPQSAYHALPPPPPPGVPQHGQYPDQASFPPNGSDRPFYPGPPLPPKPPTQMGSYSQYMSSQVPNGSY